MVQKTLDAMARGGMYDQVAGGFSRYSVDERWLVPHFEKMLYDNALLARAYLEAFPVTRDPFHQRIAAETLDYVLREMTSPDGAFYSATDADSEGEEGKFFVWTPEEIRAAVGDDEAARRFCAYYDIEEGGNFEGKSIPNTPRTVPEVAARLGIAPADLEASLATARPLVYRARLLRVPPGLDDKVLTAWNGLMISALAEGHRVLGDPRYLEAGRRAADFVLSRMCAPDGRLLRTSRGGVAHLSAYLEDYAYLADALVDLHEAGASASLPARGGSARGADARPTSPTRPRAASSPPRATTRRSSCAPGRATTAPRPPPTRWRRACWPGCRTTSTARTSARTRPAPSAPTGGPSSASPARFPLSLVVVDLLLDGPVELAFAGGGDTAGLAALRQEIARHYLPNRIVSHLDPADPVRGRAAPPRRQGAGRRPRGALRLPRLRLPAAGGRPGRGRGRAGRRLAPARPGEARVSPRRRCPAARPRRGPRATRPARPSPGPATRRSAGRASPPAGSASAATGWATKAPSNARRSSGSLRAGINILDTSTNYMDGGSERLIGSALADQVRGGALARDEAIVVTKAGYVQGANLDLAREREAAGTPFPDMVKYGDGVWHCIHPEFLRDQLQRSLDRLGLASVDVLLLHNPEYYLSDAHERSHGTLERRREEFGRRIADAFAFLEGEVAAGRIGCYGVSSNSCVRPASDPEFTSLTRMVALARKAGGDDHHFRVLQLPLNLLEPGAAVERNNGPRLERTVLEQAQADGIAVLVNRPLNAMADGGLLRLAAVAVPEGAPELDDTLMALATLEAEYRDAIAVHLETAEGGLPPAQFFRWSDDLRGVAPEVQGLEHWDALEQQRILPRLMQAVEALDGALSGPLVETWRGWRARYLPELRRALLALRARAAEASRVRVREIEGRLDPLLPPERRGETLARKALWVIASLPGVSSVLNGARTPAYVEDARAVLAWPPLADATTVLAAVAPKGD